MSELHQVLFQWIAATAAAAPWTMACARVVAVGGAWASAGLVVWALVRRPAEWRYVLLSAAACGVATLIAHYLANILAWPRPFVLGLSPAYIAHRASGALPSAHAAAMFTLALMFRARVALRSIGALLALLALATGGARVFVGVHFPMDIGAGLLLAYGLAALCRALLAWRGRIAIKQQDLGDTALDAPASPVSSMSSATLLNAQTLPGSTP